jgi:FkbM family methyltransferase
MTGPRRSIKRLVGQGVPALLGRRNAVRLGRYMLDSARLDIPNRIEENGERLVQNATLDHWDGAEPPTVIDVGGHFGEWSTHLLRSAAARRRRIELHVFEPTSFSFDRLHAALDAWPDQTITLQRKAVSSRNGAGTISKPHEGAGSSSLHGTRTQAEPTSDESVELTTLDTYCTEHSLVEVALLKIDAEGHDLEVLVGAEATLREGRIALVQFEYNHRWVSSRHFLRDAFELLLPLGFQLGKVTPKGVELYDGWDPELETFREGNYVAIGAKASGWLPTIPWWKR